MSKEPEHNATDKDVRSAARKWGLASIAASLIAASTIITYFSGLWSTAVYAGLRDQKTGKLVVVTKEEHEKAVVQMQQLDAGAAKKEDLQRVEKKVDQLDAKMDELKNILIKQKGR